MKRLDCSVCILKSEATKNLSFGELNILNQSSVEVDFKKEEVIFKQDALSSNIIYLQSGMVKLIMDGPQRKQILKIKKAPCYLGLPTAMGDKINHYSAVAIIPTRACFIDLNTFRELLRLNPDFSYEIIVELCKNELEQFHRCINLVQKQIFGRLANNLIQFSEDLYDSDEFDLPLNRNEIANLVCTSRETVSRMLTELAEEKIIKINGKKIKILNKEMLKKIRESG
ncbi:MAG: Crp/Fnr family transcriptional regulator [Bacteroidales bacterium]|nr:Crp/Fnr family transcriptional regulator [Bacteroidales bacterium]